MRTFMPVDFCIIDAFLRFVFAIDSSAAREIVNYFDRGEIARKISYSRDISEGRDILVCLWMIDQEVAKGVVKRCVIEEIAFEICKIDDFGDAEKFMETIFKVNPVVGRELANLIRGQCQKKELMQIINDLEIYFSDKMKP